MSIATRINEIETHLEDDYEALEGIGADLTGVDKNIQNIASVLSNIYNEMPKVTGTGTELTLENTRKGRITTDLQPNTSQDGTPTPSNPVDIKVVTGDNTIKVQNKNLFDKDNITSGKYLFNDGTIGTSNNYIISDYISVKTGGIYTYQGLTNVGIDPYTCYYDNSKTFVSSFKQATRTNIITIPNNVSYVRFSIRSSSGDNNTFQLEKNSTATTYVSHKEANYSINLGNIEYCVIGDYKDRIFKNVVGDIDYSSDRELGKWYIKKNILEVVYNGSESGWGNSSTYNSTFTIGKPRLMNTGETNMLSNYFSDFKSSVAQLGNYGIAVGSKVNIKNIDITDDDTAGFKTWLSTHNVKIKYPATTPTYTLLDSTLQTQLNNLYNAISYDEQTNVSQVNDDLPFILDLSALKEYE